jgi:hypothetical protein
MRTMVVMALLDACRVGAVPPRSAEGRSPRKQLATVVRRLVAALKRP